jgi:hypothetical protein
MSNTKWGNTHMKSVILTTLIAGMVLAVLTSTAWAASGQTSTKSSGREATVYDPFALRTVTVAGTPSRDPPQNAPGIVRNPNPRRDIRIPSRLPPRSAYKPASY